MFCFLGSFFCWAGYRAFRLVAEPKLHQGLYYVMWNERDKGYDKHLLCKAACETISVQTKRWRRADKTQFILLQVSFLRLFPCWIITRVLLIFKDVVNFSLPNSQLHAKPAAEVSPRGDESASERIYFIQISLFKCSEPLERSQGTWWKGNGEYRFNLWPSAKMPIRNASVSAGDRATAHCQLGINLRHVFD